jgi:hypothetical protein
MLYFPANLGREKFSKKGARKESGSMNPGVIFAQKASEEAPKAFVRGVDLLDRERDVDAGMAALEEAVNIISRLQRGLLRTVFDNRMHIGRH